MEMSWSQIKTYDIAYDFVRIDIWYCNKAT